MDERGEVKAVALSFTDTERMVQAIEEICESRKQVRDILESISDAFFALDNDGRFTYVDKKAEELLQKSKTELLFRDVWETFPEAVGSALYEAYRKVKETMQPVSFEEFYPPLETRLMVNAYPYEHGISMHFSDITECKKTAESLRKSEQRYRTLFDSIDEDFCIIEVIFDESQKPVDYRFLEISPAFEKQTGLIAAEGKRKGSLKKSAL